MDVWTCRVEREFARRLDSPDSESLQIQNPPVDDGKFVLEDFALGRTFPGLSLISRTSKWQTNDFGWSIAYLPQPFTSQLRQVGLGTEFVPDRDLVDLRLRDNTHVGHPADGDRTTSPFGGHRSISQ